MRFTTDIEVRYSETDAMGIVYHANYLSWFEVARTHLLNDSGFPYTAMEEQGFMSPVTAVSINYGLPFRYGDVARVVTWVSKVTAVRTEYSYEVYPADADIASAKPYLTGTSTHCVVEASSFKPVSQKKHFPELYEFYRSIVEPAD